MEEERIGLFLDFENLAIGAREQMGGKFDFKPIADALAERGRVVVRRAYADWSMFDDARRELTRHHIELIEIPQRMGTVRKNAADIKLAVDAIELSFEREYITTFVIGTGDSDFTPLVHKLRELNKRVIGIGIEASTSSLLPPACDEFLFYERLPGVDMSAPRASSSSSSSSRSRRGGRRRTDDSKPPPEATGDVAQLDVLVTQTLSGLKRRAGDDVVLASSLKRTLLRKDPTFNEAVYGFRTFSELLQNLAERGVAQVTMGSAPGDPEVDFPQKPAETEAFELLRDIVASLGSHPLRGLKNELRKKDPEFSEKRFGYGAFLQFCRAAEANGFIEMELDNENETYTVRPAGAGAGAGAEAGTEAEQAVAEVPEPEPQEPDAVAEAEAPETEEAEPAGTAKAKPAKKKPVRKRKPAAAKKTTSRRKAKA